MVAGEGMTVVLSCHSSPSAAAASRAAPSLAFIMRNSTRGPTNVSGSMARSDFLPSAVRNGIAALIVFDMIDDRLDGPTGETAGVADALREHRGTFDAPAELHDEAIPHVAFFVGADRAAR